MLVSGLPERLAAFAARFLRIEADVAQQMRIQVTKPAAVAAAGKNGGNFGTDAREKPARAVQRKGLDMALGHLRLLRFVLIQ
jgi:hypothetical protein